MDYHNFGTSRKRGTARKLDKNACSIFVSGVFILSPITCMKICWFQYLDKIQLPVSCHSGAKFKSKISIYCSVN